eukprot:NODE_180_length_13923_cov_0.697772.p1 type:complete len:1331 gc:universal NODE_180_length_13923_cov_0.697772:33-4025(+)
MSDLQVSSGNTEHTISDSAQRCVIDYKFDHKQVGFTTWHFGFLNLARALDVPEHMYFREMLKNLQQEYISYAMGVLAGLASYEGFVKVLGARYTVDFRAVDFYALKQGSKGVEEYADYLQRCGSIAGIKDQDIIDHFKVSLRDEISVVLIASEFGNWTAARRAALEVEKRLGNSMSKSSVQIPAASSSPSPSPFCFYCKKTGHVAKYCPDKPALSCSKCGMKGHLIRDCPKKDVNNIEVKETNSEVKLSEIYLSVCFNDLRTTCLLDTGANVSILSAKMVGNMTNVQLQKCDLGVSCGGVLKQILGRAWVRVVLKDLTPFWHWFYVLDGNYPLHPIIGTDILNDHFTSKLVIQEKDFVLNNVEYKNEIESILKPKLAHLDEKTSSMVLGIFENYHVDPLKPIKVPPIDLELKENVDLEQLRQKPYPESYPEERDEITDKYMARGFIKKGESPFSSPCFIIKQNGKARLVIDYRKVNTNTKPNGLPIPRIDDIVQDITGYKYVSCFDYETGYNQLSVSERTAQITSFVTAKSQYLNQRLGQGLRIGPGIFQHVTSELTAHIGNIRQYIDDIALFHNDLDEHLAAMAELVRVCSEFNIILKLSKCQIIRSEVEFCGYMISQHGYKAKDSYLVEIQSLKSPDSKRKTHKILGMLSWVKPFIPHFEEVVQPIRDVISMKSKFIWSPAAETALRNALDLASQHQISNIKNGPDCELFVDASKGSIGGAIFQNGILVGLFSRKLNRTMQNWDCFEKELYGVYVGLNKFGRYLGGNRVIIRSDNEAAIYLLNGMGKKKSPKILRWIESIQLYDYDAYHISGAKNQLADMLSRFEHRESVEEKEDPQFSVNQVETRSRKRARLEEEAAESMEVEPTVQQPVVVIEPVVESVPVSSAPVNLDTNLIKCHCGIPRQDDVVECTNCGLYSHKSCIAWMYTPSDFFCGRCNQLQNKRGNIQNRDEQIKLLQSAHLSHPGRNAMRIMLRQYQWNTKEQDIKDCIENCRFCVEKKEPIMAKLQLRKPKRVNHMCAIDLLEIKEECVDYSHVVVMREYVTGVCVLHPIPNKSPVYVLEALLKYLASYGKMAVLICDNGTEFKAQFKEYCEKVGIHMEYSTPRVSHENGYAESAIRVAKSMIRVARKEFPELPFEVTVQMANFWINSNPKYNTGMSPTTLMTMINSFGDGLDTNIRNDLIKEINKMKVKQEIRFNRGLRHVEISVGDSVWYYPPNTKLKLKTLAKLGKVMEIVREKQYLIHLEGESKSFIAHSDDLVPIKNEMNQGECLEFGNGDVNHLILNWQMDGNEDGNERREQVGSDPGDWVDRDVKLPNVANREHKREEDE